MKQILKYSFVFASLMVAKQSIAQLKLGVTAGISLNKAKTDLLKNNVTNLSIPFGIAAEVNLGNNFLFRPSILYSTHGASFTESTTQQLSPTVELRTSYQKYYGVNYMQIPLDIAYQVETENGKLFISLAPVISIGVNSLVKEDVKLYVNNQLSKDTTIKNSLKLGSSGTFKRTDFGGRIGLGYELKNGLQVHAYYKQGFRDIAVGPSKYRNNEFLITLSYFLKKIVL
jgi:hypothetical protein